MRRLSQAAAAPSQNEQVEVCQASAKNMGCFVLVDWFLKCERMIRNCVLAPSVNHRRINAYYCQISSFLMCCSLAFLTADGMEIRAQ